MGEKGKGNVKVVAMTPSLNKPNGVAWHEGALYVAEVGADRTRLHSMVARLHAAPLWPEQDHLQATIHMLDGCGLGLDPPANIVAAYPQYCRQ